MCVICVKEKGKVIPTSWLRKMFDAEPHGSGFAVSLGSKVFYRKGFMDFDEFMREFERWNSEHYSVTVHFRTASVGRVIPELTHPFPLTNHKKQLLFLEGEVDVVIFHNGTVSEWRENGLSDTASLAKFLGKLRQRYGVPVSDLVKFLKSIGGFNRFVLQTPRKIYLVGDFKEKDGLYFSNLNWDTSFGFGYKSYWKRGWHWRWDND